MKRIRREPAPALPLVVLLSSEAVPFSKTGGLADVAGALPIALRKAGFDVVLVTPRYGSVDPAKFRLAKRLKPMSVPLGAKSYDVDTFEGKVGDARVFLIDYPPAFAREGLYRDASGDFADNAFRFALFSRSLFELCLTFDLRPAILHANDWQAALALYYLKREFAAHPLFASTRGVFTIHNLAYQGLFPPAVLEELGVGWDLFKPEGIEFWGKVNFLKAGVLFADAVTTVSERYAAEIQTKEFGCGLEGLLQARAGVLSGIVNGIDADVWNPRTDKLIPATYSEVSMTGKGKCKLALQGELGLARDPDVPLIGMISRLADQKGFDLVEAAADWMMAEGVQVAVLGTGEAVHEAAARALAARYPGRFSATIGFNDGLAHRIEAGTDMFMMPSRYEPCGLNQLYSLRYGTVPIVRATGGLDDTVDDVDELGRSGTGFKFHDATGEALLGAVQRAVRAYSDAAVWRGIVRRGMARDFTWGTSAERYARLYRGLMADALAARVAG
ncbi:MAG: glycogen synthase GlgA [Deltaproteobacteria bacterium]|nr:glycogen synthase GlgA [Deltaproteobacteria bacterium]